MPADFIRPGAKRLAQSLAKECVRADMNDALEATTVLAVLLCKLVAKEEGIPFAESLGELIEHAAEVIDDGSISIADWSV